MGAGAGFGGLGAGPGPLTGGFGGPRGKNALAGFFVDLGNIFERAPNQDTRNAHPSSSFDTPGSLTPLAPVGSFALILKAKSGMEGVDSEVELTLSRARCGRSQRRRREKGCRERGGKRRAL